MRHRHVVGRRLFSIWIATLLITTVALVANAKLESIGHSKLSFLAIGPAGLKINGQGSGLSAKEKDGKISVVAPLTNLKTGIGLRDEHLRGYLKTSAFPNAKLVVSRKSLKLPKNGAKAKSKATGKLTLHGVTKPVTFRYLAKRTGSDYHVQGLLDIDIRDFDIEVPCYLGVCVDPHVKIKVGFKLRER